MAKLKFSHGNSFVRRREISFTSKKKPMLALLKCFDTADLPILADRSPSENGRRAVAIFRHIMAFCMGIKRCAEHQYEENQQHEEYPSPGRQCFDQEEEERYIHTGLKRLLLLTNFPTTMLSPESGVPIWKTA